MLLSLGGTHIAALTFCAVFFCDPVGAFFRKTTLSQSCPLCPWIIFSPCPLPLPTLSPSFGEGGGGLNVLTEEKFYYS